MKKCLNCGTKLSGPYCHQCGQSAQTHRYSLKSLFTHELLHHLWHVDKSVFRSWWFVMLQPGQEARKNIAGKRAGQFPILTLALFATVILLLAVNFRNPPHDRTALHIGEQDYSDWVRHHAKWIWLGMILFFAAASDIFFRKTHYNLAEHIVTVTYIYVGAISLLAVCVFFSRLFPHEWTWPGWLPFMLFMIYLSYAYWQSFSGFYKAAGWLWRYLAALFTGWIFILCLILLLSVCFRRTITLHLGSDNEENSSLAAPAP